jgi:UDP-glucose 4-epimerase
MKVLITGCAGLIGTNFCEYLIDTHPDIKIIGVDNLSGGIVENVPKEVTFIKADLTIKEDQKLIEQAFKDGYIDYIFAFAAIACEGLSPFIRQYTFINNCVANAFLINMGIKYNIKRFIFTSSMATYGINETPYTEDMLPNPIDTYGIAKYACEMDLKVAYDQHGMEYCIIVPHNVYGKYQNIWDPYRNVLGIWMYKALNNEPFTIYGDGEQTRSFSYIQDILPCLWVAATSDKTKNERINVGGKKNTTLNDAAKLLTKVTGTNNIIHLESRHEIKHAWSSYEKSERLLNFKETVDLEEGLQKMWDWVKTTPNRKRKFWDEYELDTNIYSFWKISQ